MAKGDIVLIPFPFTDLTGNKLRPAVVLIDSSFDLTVSFITSQIKWADNTDIALPPSTLNGIKRPSLIRLAKIATIDKTLVAGKLGVLSQNEIIDLNQKLKTLLKLH